MKSFLLALVMVVVVSLVASRRYIPCPPEVSARCPPLGNMAVLLPHPHFCSKYCECVDEGLAYVLPCPEKLLWDEKINTCNWPDNVDCGNRPVQLF
ncbi:hypothetical protein O3P69_005107 [Scylla paramamosain]|uniref:Chitin-binding type-2 domain-containing protein n=1 Tax=Scylla paramamosain TaxID=85552 RepID=A0AAW0UBE4_SCYPA